MSDVRTESGLSPTWGPPVEVFVAEPLGTEAAGSLNRLFGTDDAYEVVASGPADQYAPADPADAHTTDPSALDATTGREGVKGEGPVYHARVLIDEGPGPFCIVRFEPGTRTVHVYTSLCRDSPVRGDSCRHTLRQVREAYLVLDVFRTLDAVAAGLLPERSNGSMDDPFEPATWPRGWFVEALDSTIVDGRSLTELSVPRTIAMREFPDGSVAQLARFALPGGTGGEPPSGSYEFRTDWVPLPPEPPTLSADGSDPGYADDAFGVLEWLGSWDFPEVRRSLAQRATLGDPAFARTAARLVHDERRTVRREAAWVLGRYPLDGYFADEVESLEGDGDTEVAQAVLDGRRTAESASDSVYEPHAPGY